MSYPGDIECDLGKMEGFDSLASLVRMLPVQRIARVADGCQRKGARGAASRVGERRTGGPAEYGDSASAGRLSLECCRKGVDPHYGANVRMGRSASGGGADISTTWSRNRAGCGGGSIKCLGGDLVGNYGCVQKVLAVVVGLGLSGSFDCVRQRRRTSLRMTELCRELAGLGWRVRVLREKGSGGCGWVGIVGVLRVRSPRAANFAQDDRIMEGIS